ncbi:MAG: FG-GAP-like repeat-containing protein [Bacteroidia bacterium]|nr:FG-GAP-like repeat-containing protein [Bacteroidia bacterium]
MKNIYLSLFLVSLIIPGMTQSFQRVDQQAGLNLVTNNHGVSVADYDLDGDLDIFFVGIPSFELSDENTWSRLMRNMGDGSFQDVTLEAGFDKQFINYGVPAARGEKMGASWGDYDNDGYPDIFLTNSRKDQLYHNNGDGTFTDVTSDAGVDGCLECYSGSGLWWDQDRDGDLDLFVSMLNDENIMYKNLGNGTFEDITEEMGMGGFGITWTSVALDVNNDGFLDLYNINDTQPNQLWISKGGLRFEEAGTAYRVNDEGAGMGIAIGDYNNDGNFDMYITNIYEHHPNPLYHNTGQHRFSDKAESLGVENSGWGWGTEFFDYDHDGDEDLFAVNGPIDKLFGEGQESVNNFFFKNMLMEGSNIFDDWSTESGTADTTGAKGLEVFDFDNDGDLDILVANMRTSPFLYRNSLITNSTPSTANWLKIQLEGTISNKNAFGTKLIAKANGQTYHRYYHGASLFSQSIQPVHFGLGNASQVEELIIHWNSGLKDTLKNIALNQTLKILETPGDPSEIPIVPVFTQKQEVYAYPNPFESSATLHFEMPTAGDLEVRIFSSSGQRVFNHTFAFEGSGILEIPWGGESIQEVPAGIYYYRAVFTTVLKKQKFEGKILKR